MNPLTLLNTYIIVSFILFHWIFFFFFRSHVNFRGTSLGWKRKWSRGKRKMLFFFFLRQILYTLLCISDNIDVLESRGRRKRIEREWVLQRKHEESMTFQGSILAWSYMYGDFQSCWKFADALHRPPSSPLYRVI